MDQANELGEEAGAVVALRAVRLLRLLGEAAPIAARSQLIKTVARLLDHSRKCLFLGKMNPDPTKAAC
jgi:hypothetical protein